MKIGILTSGGDAPGMNAAIRGVVKAAEYHGIEVYGIKKGYQGLIDDEIKKLKYLDVDNIAELGGTILKTARSMEFMEEAGRLKAVEVLKKHKIDNLVVVGGDGSFKGAAKLNKLGVKVIGLPGTIDNDLSYTNYCIGFDTALNTVLDSIGRIKDTGSSHEKGTILEVMGRYCGDLALYAAISGAGEMISTPEKKLSFDEICDRLQKNINIGKNDNIVIVTERMYNVEELKKYIEEKLGIGIRTTVLGFVQRGGRPSGFDRMFAGKMAIKAVELLKNGISGKAIGLRDNKIIAVDFDKIDETPISKDEEYETVDMLL